MTKKQKGIAILLAALIWVAVIGVAFMLTIKPATDDVDQGKLGGLLNPNNVTAPTPVTQEDATTAESEKPSISLTSQSMITERTTEELASGNFGSLDSYLHGIESGYRDNEQLDSSPMIFIERIRGDLAMITGIKEENGGQLLRTFMTPEVLASAMVYLPISQKYLSFINLDSIVIPEMEKGTLSDLCRQPDKDVEVDRLTKLNDGREIPFVEVALYNVTLCDRPFELTLVLQESGFWAPYLMTTEDTTGLLDVQKTKKIAESILNTGNSVDDMISYE